MGYAAENIRNIAFLGHQGNGKTTLAESILFTAGAIDRQGNTLDGNTVSDYDEQEIKRKISISASTMYAEYKNHKINIIDTPGYFDFVGEVYEALRVADIGVIVVSAKEQLNVGAEKAWKYLSERNLPRAIYVSKTDEEHANFNNTYEALRNKFGKSVCALVDPIIENDKVVGIVEVVAKKAYRVNGKKMTETPIPDNMKDRIEEQFNDLMESAAGTSEELMEKYFDEGAISAEEISGALGIGIKTGEICPVYCGSAISNMGTSIFMDAIISMFPAPSEQGEPIDPNGPPKAIIYKTVSDQFGKYSLFKVISGSLTPDMTLYNPRSQTQEKLGHIYQMQGKKTVEVKDIGAGDIGALSKLSATKTGDTLAMTKDTEPAPGVEFDRPCYSRAVQPKVKGQDDKVAQGIARLREEDVTLTVENNKETHQMVLSAMGDMQLDVVCARLKSRFGVDVDLTNVKVPYREKIRKKIEAHGRHKKQSGGHGQFGDVWIRFEPQDESEDMIFAEEVFGGSVPKNFFPAVEKGLRESTQKGVLAGYPMVYLKATLYDGSYHPVDSSEMAFKTAAGLAYKELVNASPALLEPIGLLKVTIPDANMGDIMSDLSKRRGNPMGMSVDKDGNQVVEAEVPMAEMGTYAIDLRSMTQGRGSFTFDFVRYDEAPVNVQQKVIEEAKANADE